MVNSVFRHEVGEKRLVVDCLDFRRDKDVELRQMFMDEGLVVRSQNDGESCVHAVERYINRGEQWIEAIRHAYGDLQGDYAYVIGRITDDKLYAIKKGSGLVVGIGEGFTCVSSDLPSILPLTRNILRVQDGEIVPACAQTCPTEAIVFGNMNDPNSRIAKMFADKRNYHLLEEINTLPSVGYLTKVRNNEDKEV